MDPFTATAVALAGSGVQGWWQGQNQRAANDWNEYAMQRRHQWEVADLKAAGLNPLLSAGGTPGGISGAAPAQAPDINSALTAASQREMLREQVENIQADTKQKDTQSELNMANKGLVQEQHSRAAVETTTAQFEQNAREAVLAAQIEQAKQQAHSARASGDWSDFLTNKKGVAEVKNIGADTKLKESTIRSQTVDRLIKMTMNPKDYQRLTEEVNRLGYENVGNAIEADIDRGGTGELGRVIDRFKALFGLSWNARDVSSRNTSRKGK